MWIKRRKQWSVKKAYVNESAQENKWWSKTACIRHRNWKSSIDRLTCLFYSLAVVSHTSIWINSNRSKKFVPPKRLKCHRLAHTFHFSVWPSWLKSNRNRSVSICSLSHRCGPSQSGHLLCNQIEIYLFNLLYCTAERCLSWRFLGKFSGVERNSAGAQPKRMQMVSGKVIIAERFGSICIENRKCWLPPSIMRLRRVEADTERHHQSTETAIERGKEKRPNRFHLDRIFRPAEQLGTDFCSWYFRFGISFVATVSKQWQRLFQQWENTATTKKQRPGHSLSATLYRIHCSAHRYLALL